MKTKGTTTGYFYLETGTSGGGWRTRGRTSPARKCRPSLFRLLAEDKKERTPDLD